MTDPFELIDRKRDKSKNTCHVKEILTVNILCFILFSFLIIEVIIELGSESLLEDL